MVALESPRKRAFDRPPLLLSVCSPNVELDHRVRTARRVLDDRAPHPDRRRDVDRADGVMRVNVASARERRGRGGMGCNCDPPHWSLRLSSIKPMADAGLYAGN